MSTTVQPMTAADLLRMPDDGFRHELVNGNLLKIPPSEHEHGTVTVRFSWRLAQHVETNDLGTVYAAGTGFLISSKPDTVRAPDVAFVSRKRIDEAGYLQGYWPGPPDLAVEVISPSDTYTEVEEKALEWLGAGALMVLVLNPRKRTATIYRSMNEIVILDEHAVLDLTDIVPGFKLAVNDIFG